MTDNELRAALQLAREKARTEMAPSDLMSVIMAASAVLAGRPTMMERVAIERRLTEALDQGLAPEGSGPSVGCEGVGDR